MTDIRENIDDKQKLKIVISKSGTIFQVGSTQNTVMLTDDNCIWNSNDEVHFTRKGWEEYRDRKEYLSESIDRMRDI